MKLAKIAAVSPPRELPTKRLEEGTFRLPKLDDAARKSIELRPSELAMLLDGIDLRSVRRTKRYHPKA